MPKKIYRLTEFAEPFIRDDTFSFRVQYSKPTPNGRARISKDKCPVLEVERGGTISTNDEHAQKMIEMMTVPQNTVRNGQRWPSGPMFEEVAGPNAKIKELDTEFEKARKNPKVIKPHARRQ